MIYVAQSPWDLGETHSNVAKLSNVRALLSKAAVAEYSARQIDVGNAYLCANIASEHVFCSQPEGGAVDALPDHIWHNGGDGPLSLWCGTNWAGAGPEVGSPVARALSSSY